MTSLPAAAEEVVVPVAALERVDQGVAEQAVVEARASRALDLRERVRAVPDRLAGREVDDDADPPVRREERRVVDGVRPGAADERVRAGEAAQPVAAGAPVEGVPRGVPVRTSAPEPPMTFSTVVMRSRSPRARAGAGRQVDDHAGRARRIVDRVGAGAAVEDVPAGAGDERVVPGAAREGVRPRPTRERVAARAAGHALHGGQGVGARGAGVLGPGERQVDVQLRGSSPSSPPYRCPGRRRRRCRRPCPANDVAERRAEDVLRASERCPCRRRRCSARRGSRGSA